jgi:hypothetical protein
VVFCVAKSTQISVSLKNGTDLNGELLFVMDSSFIIETLNESEESFDTISENFNQNKNSYVEIMNQLNLDPSRDAGKFAYHLRTLRQAGLLEIDKITKKYRLTSLGIMIIDFSQIFPLFLYVKTDCSRGYLMQFFINIG